MKAEIEFVGMAVSDAVTDHVNKKVGKLTDRYSWITNVAVFLKEENSNDGRNMKCEIRLSVPGPQIFAESLETDMYGSINETIRDLEVQLEKHKNVLYKNA